MARKILTENYKASNGLEVDSVNHVIKGVKILGLESLNKRRYTPEACQAAVDLYEGIPVNADHPERDPKQPRSIRDRIGDLVNVHFVEGKGLYGDLRYNPAQPIAKQLVYWAKKMPHCVGLSHNAVGQGDDDKNGVFVVEQITEVRSVDLVADPATTKSLCEGKGMAKKTKTKAEEFLLEADETDTMANTQEDENDLKTSILTILSGEGDDKSKADKIAELFGQMQDTGEEKEDMEEADDDTDDSDEPDGDEYDDNPMPPKSKNTKESREIQALNAKVKELTEQRNRDKKESFIRRLCEAKNVKLDKKTFQTFMALPNREMLEHAVGLAAKATRNTAPRSGPFAELTESYNESASRLPKDRQALANFLQS